jgi:putative ABC transport system substrate-binding protein
VTRAQQPAVPVIGYLDVKSESSARPYTAAFQRGLGEQGYVAGRNVEVLYRWAENQYDRLPALATDLVQRRVAAIFATGNPAAPLATKQTTATIPIVFQFGADPVELGLVASLNRPGGNVTGVTMLSKTLTAKRLELLHECVPAVTSIGFLVNSGVPAFEAEVGEAETAARILVF